ncbi:MAG: AMP-binding protein, partial [bacterium]|nr:AMP-binding protein [bacterium]
KTIHQLIANQVEREPDKIAVVHGDDQLSYAVSNERANRFARELTARGIGPGCIVAIMMERSIRLLVALLGVLKAGGAFLPLDSAYPETRKKFILQDSEAKILITHKHLAEPGNEIWQVPTLKDIMFSGDSDNNTCPPAVTVRRQAVAPGKTRGSNIAYIIYTSGTTGRPKGAAVEQQSLVNYSTWAAKTYTRNGRANFPLYTSIAFDLTVTSIFTPLLTGNAIVVYEEDTATILERIIADNKVEVVKVSPSHLKTTRYEKVKNSGIKCLIVGGEELETTLALDIYKNFAEKIAIYNEYGPT